MAESFDSHAWVIKAALTPTKHQTRSGKRGREEAADGARKNIIRTGTASIWVPPDDPRPAKKAKTAATSKTTTKKGKSPGRPKKNTAKPSGQTKTGASSRGRPRKTAPKPPVQANGERTRPEAAPPSSLRHRGADRTQLTSAASQTDPDAPVQLSLGLDDAQDEYVETLSQVESDSSSYEPFGEDEEEEEEEAIPTEALLGADSKWQIILEAAGKNLDPKKFLRDRKGVHVRRCATDEAKEVYARVRSAAVIYEQLRRPDDDDAAAQAATLAEDLQVILLKSSLLEQFNNKSLVGVELRNAKGTIRDLYLRLIPGMVYLLRCGMLCRYNRSPEGYEVSGMMEVLDIMKTAIDLCYLAARWHKKPEGSTPIVKSIRSVVFPNLRSMLKTFELRLISLKREERRQSNFRQALATKNLAAQIDSQWCYHSPSTSELQAQLDDVEAQHRFSMSQTPQHIRQARRTAGTASQVYPREDVRVEWTEDEERELLTRLVDASLRNLPARERYIAIAACDMLQGKRPDHIRNQALILKPYMIDQYGPRGYLTSIC